MSAPAKEDAAKKEGAKTDSSHAAAAAMPPGQPSPSAETATPAGPTPSSQGSSPFYVFAAGLVGALVALVLMFLANVVGLFTPTDSRLDDQLVQLSGLERRVSALESAGGNDLVAEDARVDGLLDTIATLQTEVADLRLPSDPDASAIDVGALIDIALVDRLADVDERITLLEGQSMESVSPSVASQDASEVTDQSIDLSALEADIASLRAAVADLDGLMASRDEGEPALDVTQLTALIEAETQSLQSAIQALRTSMATSEDRLSALDAQMMADREPNTVPDHLARLGLAVQWVRQSRDDGLALGPALRMLSQAVTFDATLADEVGSLETYADASGLSQPALVALFDASVEALVQASPEADGSSGLLGALQDRARQMVSIRAPDGQSVLVPGDDLSDQLGATRTLLTGGDYAGALAAWQGLPPAMQETGSALAERLAARIAIDAAVAQAQHFFLSQMADLTVSQ